MTKQKHYLFCAIKNALLFFREGHFLFPGTAFCFSGSALFCSAQRVSFAGSCVLFATQRVSFARSCVLFCYAQRVSFAGASYVVTT